MKKYFERLSKVFNKIELSIKFNTIDKFGKIVLICIFVLNYLLFANCFL